ncbi:MAG: hypothetical protein ACYTEQ_10155 [Planctomycetota bacterium]
MSGTTNKSFSAFELLSLTEPIFPGFIIAPAAPGSLFLITWLRLRSRPVTESQVNNR